MSKKRLLFILVAGLVFTPSALAGQMSFRQTMALSIKDGAGTCPLSGKGLEKGDRSVAGYDKKVQSKVGKAK